MKLHTETSLCREDEIKHDHRILSLGSCFAERIGERLNTLKFKVTANPMGTLYNPEALANIISRALQDKPFDTKDGYEHHGMWHNLELGSRCSQLSQEALLKHAQEALTTLSQQLRQADVLIITWGTSWVYRHIARDLVVGNCNQISTKEFHRYRLSNEAIISRWTSLLEELKIHNPKLRIILTVSPVRHLKDGSHGNQLSKATLLLACEHLCNSFDHLHYFPAYELLLDDLRDYRFYAEDMVHPSLPAVNYIFEAFAKCYFSSDTLDLIKQIETISKSVAHRPFHPNNPKHQLFLKQQLQQVYQLQQTYPNVDWEKEIAFFKKEIG